MDKFKALLGIVKQIISFAPYLADFIQLAEVLFGAKTGPAKAQFIKNLYALAQAEGEPDVLGTVISAKVEAMKASGELVEAKGSAV